MNSLLLAVFICATAVGFGQEAVVQKSTIWMDTVKRGDMTRAIRGLGVLAANRIGEISIPEAEAQPIRPGQSAQIDTRNGVVRAKVVRVFPGVANGLVKVEVQTEGAMPSGAVPGLNVDATIEVEVVK